MKIILKIFIFLILTIFLFSVVNCRTNNIDKDPVINSNRTENAGESDVIDLSEGDNAIETDGNSLGNNTDEGNKEVPDFTIEELSNRVRTLISSSVKLLRINKNSLFLFSDLNNDNIQEVLALGVKPDANVELSTYSDFSSLFLENRSPCSFFLYIFEYAAPEYILHGYIDLGLKYVYSGFDQIQIVKNSKFPFVISLNFHTYEGIEQEWLVFDEKNMPVFELSLKDTFSSKLVLNDIDSDGNMDIIIQEKGAEEGMGYETFLTWLKWNGRRFKEYKSSNIVRNLKTFLSDVKKLILEKEWQAVLNLCFNPQAISLYKSQGWSNTGIIFKAFGLSSVYDLNSDTSINILSSIKNIIFPEILENPFINEDSKGNYFNISFRIIDVNEIYVVSEMSLYIYDNPFNKNQFFFDIP